MDKPTIATDIDDVLADSTEALRLYVNARHAVELQPHHYRIKAEYWGYYESVWRNHDIDGDGIIDDFHGTISTDQTHVRPVDGSVEALNLLSNKYRLVAISSRLADQKNATKQWLDTHFQGVFDAVECLGSRQGRSTTKGEACAKHGAGLLIDDNVEHCRSAVDSGIKAILFGEYGWQDEALLPDNVVRCPDWSTVMEVLGAEARFGF